MSFLTLMLPRLIALVIRGLPIQPRVARRHSELQSADRSRPIKQKTAALLARVSDLEATAGASSTRSQSVAAPHEGIKGGGGRTAQHRCGQEATRGCGGVDAALSPCPRPAGHASVQALAPFRRSRQRVGPEKRRQQRRALQKLENSLGKDLTACRLLDRNKADSPDRPSSTCSRKLTGTIDLKS
jgi:hypothetical protein